MHGTEHRDRSTGLKVFGIIEILIGGGCGLLALLTAGLTAATAILPPANSPGALQVGLSPRAALPSLSLYLVTAVVFVGLGIGSMRARSWAREWTLSVAWIWLFTGLSSILMAALVWTEIVETGAAMAGLPESWVAVTLLGLFGIFTLFHVLLPGLMILFYRHPDVVATCAARDRREDRPEPRPTAVSSLSLLYLLLAYSVLLLPVYGIRMPFFGAVLDGWAAVLVAVVAAVAWTGLAWASLARTGAAWWWGLVASVIATIASTVSLGVHPAAEFLRDMALSAEEIRFLQAAVAPFSKAAVVGLSLATWLSMIAYQVAVKRYFGAPR